VHERLGAPADARSAWQRALTLNHAASNVAGEAVAAEGLARADRLLQVAPERVIAGYEEALALALRVGDGPRELSVRNALGIVHWQCGAYADAMRQYEAALRVSRGIGDRVHEALILNSLGATLHRQRRWDEARTTLADGVRVARETGERQLEAHALATLGDVFLACGRLSEARQSVESSLGLRRDLADRRGEGWMLERLAQGEPADAATILRDCAAIAQELHDEPLRDAVVHLQRFDPSDSLPS
jgi:tetratricopeptide (TPR) repeat protein